MVKADQWLYITFRLTLATVNDAVALGVFPAKPAGLPTKILLDIRPQFYAGIMGVTAARHACFTPYSDVLFIS